MKKTVICLIISLGVACSLVFLERSSFYQILNLKLYDLQMNLRKPPDQDPRILFVEMDEEAINTLGRWPWPRNILAHIIDTLASLGARQIIFDITFAQPNQIIIDRQAVGHIFQGKDQISGYITDEIGALKGKETVSQQDAAWVLDQVQKNFLEFAGAAEQKLHSALVDNDQALAESFRKSDSFIGYSFEVITEKNDLEKDRVYPRIRDAMVDWADSRLDQPFEALPSSLKKNAYFNAADLKKIFLRAKIQSLIKKNIEISLEEAARQLGADPKGIRPDFYLVKHQMIVEKILAALESSSNAQLLDIIYQLEIFDPDTQQLFQEAWPRIQKEFTAAAKFGKSLPKGQGFLKAKSMEAPIVSFSGAVKGGGFLNGIPHQDGVLRSVPLFIKYKDRVFPHIAIASILELYRPEQIMFDPGKYFILHKADISGQSKDVFIPIDKDGTILINWAGRWQDTFRHISGGEIYRLFFMRDAAANAQDDPNQTANLQKELEEKEAALAKAVKDSICIIGLTAAGTHDFNPIPYESTYPMVGTHGNVLNSILTHQFITRAPASVNFAILAILGILMGIFLSLLSSVNGLFFTMIISASIFLASFHWFQQGLWLNLASPSLLALFSYLGITSYKFSTEEKAKRQIKNAFSKYVSPEVIEEILQDPSKLRLGGDRKELTVLFSDIRGFTTYSEKRKPEEVVSILNEYLDAMTKVIVAHKGTLDKYVGDEIMAVFGAPHFQPPEENAKSAVTCALKMLERLKELHEEWKQRGLEPLDIGIGINTGEMVVGNMGSELRMDYTVIGDAVNLGARVEALTRQFNVRLIVTEATYVYIKSLVEARPLESIKVKGKEIPVTIYEVISLK